MNDSINISINDFDYELPEARIAKYPLPNRDQSKLLVWENGQLKTDLFANCVNYLPENSLLVFNNTRVIHARLFFWKETGSKIELFCLEPLIPRDHQLAFQQQKEVVWKCMVGNSKKWKSGILKREIEVGGQKLLLNAERMLQTGDTSHIRFSWNKAISFTEIIEQTGILPIPPYLNRETEQADEESYQTIYAQTNGSVAAPTAGLHFTREVLNNLPSKNIRSQHLTLHVGAGTFQPVKSDNIAQHTMHNEVVRVSKPTLDALIHQRTKIIAVGTTSVRSLESLYWLGLQLENNTFNPVHPEVLQWEPYETEPTLSPKKALQHILDYLEKTNQESIQFSTRIIIAPGYRFKLIHGMFTNFHQPKSTLLLLIAAFLGHDWENVYRYALNNHFRFLSYGDSNLYLK